MEKTVTNQKELDQAIKDNMEIIIGDTTEWLTIKRINDTKIKIKLITGNAKIKLITGNVAVDIINGKATIVTISRNVRVRRVCDLAIIENIQDKVVISTVCDYAIIYRLSGQALLKRVFDYVKIQYINGQANIQSISGQATVQHIDGKATIDFAYGDVDILRMSGDTVIHEVCGYVTIQYIFDNAVISAAFGSVTIKHVLGRAKIVVASKKVSVEHIGPNAVIVYHKEERLLNKALYTKEDFIQIYGCYADGYVTLYKSVNPETLCDHHNSTLKFENTVVCPDWNPEKFLKYGTSAIYLYPTVFLAQARLGTAFLSQNSYTGKILECMVHKDDFVVDPFDISMVGCKKVTVVGEIETSAFYPY